ncbi:MobF family relaxase [Mycobacteroides abscessus]|uniref:MobF family relaxase n=1 Tax=Mycobacteroides abscessus TaxID=36809 RepID=UPI0009A8CBA6|nr:MobF family relaxase [Mycobacteroides abscessus]SLH35782.1 TrwC relaxase [Mycobacteroides abscessus subsp. massiliense]
MLTLSKPMRASSVSYYVDTAQAATAATMDRQAANGGLGEYYSEGATRAPVWVVVGDRVAAERVGLSAAEAAGGEADLAVVTRWLDDGIAPNGDRGRAYSEGSTHGFDLTFCAPKSVSLIRAMDTDGVVSKAVLDAHTRAIDAAMDYLHRHAGYTRVHNSGTGQKDLQRLPGFVAAAFQHETSRAGDPHLHTHVILPNRQLRADGSLVSYDSTSLHFEAKAASVLYQVTLRAELSASLGLEWATIDPHSGHADIAGISRKTIEAWSQRSTQLRQWAAANLTVVEAENGATAAQLAAAQRATRPAKPEHLAWGALREMWAADERGFSLDETAQQQARQDRLHARRTVWDAANEAAEGIDTAAFTRAEMVEAIAARMPTVIDNLPAGVTPASIVEVLADRMMMPLTAPRQAHERERCEKFTTAAIIAEERGIYALIGARNDAAKLPTKTITEAPGLSEDQVRSMRQIAASTQLVQTLSAPAGAGKTTSLKVLREAAHRGGIERVLVVAPTGKAADVALAEGAADSGGTVARALSELRAGRLTFDARTLLVVDEAGMVGTSALGELLAAATAAGTKAVLVGDAEQLAPVKARGGMFARLCADLPWAQELDRVWRMRDPAERAASLALRSGAGAQLDEAVGWYRDQRRLHTGDPVTMADDALKAWTADRAAGADALLIADRWEVADAINERIHRQAIGPDAPTITVARRHKIGVGDTIITRHNDPAITVYDGQDKTPIEGAPVRNGQRWEVVKIDVDGDRIAARRIGDGALTVLAGEYLHKHVHLGYAVTVHAAQGVTADRCHALLSPAGTRSAAYVAMTRGRQTNQVYLYEQAEGEADHEHGQTAEGQTVAQRGTDQDAAEALSRLLDRDNRPLTVVDVAEDTPREALPQQVLDLLDARDQAVTAARSAYDQDRAAARAARQEAAARRAAREDKAQLAAELDWIKAAGDGWSPAAAVGRSPGVDDLLASDRGLDDTSRALARTLTTEFSAVQPLHVQDRDTKTALLATLAAATRADGKLVLAVPGTDHARSEAAQYTNKNLYPADKMQTILAGLDSPSRREQRDKTRGALIVVDDAEHLDPEQLQGLCEQAGKHNAKLLLVTSGESRHRDAPGQAFIDTTHAHLPWARRIADTEAPAPDTAINRAQHRHPVKDRETNEILSRATELIKKYEDRHKPLRINRSSRSIDRSYGLDL